MNDAVQKLIDNLPDLNIDHVSVCLTMRERDSRRRRLWVKKQSPSTYAKFFSEYWKRKAENDPDLARRIIGVYLEYYSKSGDPNRNLDCTAHPEFYDLEGMIRSPGPYVGKSIAIAVSKVTGAPAPTKRTVPPPLASQAASATKSVLKWAAAGLKRVSDEELERRKAICAGCEFWDAQAFQGTGRCLKCGCSTWAKLQMASEKCPIDKWGPFQG